MALCMTAWVRQLAAPGPSRSAARLHRLTAPPATGAPAPTAEAMSPGPICAAAGIAAATDTAKTAAAAAKVERRRGMLAMTWIMVLPFRKARPFSESPALPTTPFPNPRAIEQPIADRLCRAGMAADRRRGQRPCTPEHLQFFHSWTAPWRTPDAG